VLQKSGISKNEEAIISNHTELIKHCQKNCKQDIIIECLLLHHIQPSSQK